MSGSERYIEQYRERKVGSTAGAAAPPSRRRMVALTAAFAPMTAFAAFPVTAIVAVLASIVARATTSWVGAVLLGAVVLASGHLMARWAADWDPWSAVRGWRRWLPLVATVAVVALCLAEILSGGRTPDPVIGLWVASMVWVGAFLPLGSGAWGIGRRALWVIGPVLTTAVILLLWTDGFFAWRFARAVPDLDELAARVADGGRIEDGSPVGGFVAHDVNVGRLGRAAGCDIELWITGWHQEDTRYVVRCLDDPRGDLTRVSGDWWELEDRRPPSNLLDG